MAIFCMIGKYNQGALENVSSTRTKQAEQLIARYNGTIKMIYALLGENDVIIIVELPSIEDAMKVSIGLTKLTGISFITSPAVSVEDLDIFSQVES